jgi:hypothetical protein
MMAKTPEQPARPKPTELSAQNCPMAVTDYLQRFEKPCLFIALSPIFQPGGATA